MKESELQSKVKTKMERAGWLVNKIIQSTNNGWPDLECFKNGETIFIECKAEGERPDPLQVYRHDQIRKQGFKVLVVDNIHNFIA
jgi:Holliday junction resolvase